MSIDCTQIRRKWMMRIHQPCERLHQTINHYHKPHGQGWSDSILPQLTRLIRENCPIHGLCGLICAIALISNGLS